MGKLAIECMCITENTSPVNLQQLKCAAGDRMHHLVTNTVSTKLLSCVSIIITSRRSNDQLNSKVEIVGKCPTFGLFYWST